MAARIIYLNGCSSSGKTTLARALQDDLMEPYLHVCIDAFEEMMPRKYDGRGYTHTEVLSKLIRGMHDSITALAARGNNLIVDHILIADSHPEDWVSGGLQCVQGFDLLLVGVMCPLPIMRQREEARGDRRIGLSAWQFNRVHRGIVYDLEIDTSVSETTESVHLIRAALATKFA